MEGLNMEYTKIINGFRIIEDRETARKECVNLTIIYMSDGKFFAKSQYKNVQICVVKDIKERLMDNTIYNLNVQFQCQAIALPTLIFQVEDIIKKAQK